MKDNYPSTRSGLKAILAGLCLIGTLATKAQCNANFTYTLGANGTVTVTSTSSGTTASTSYTWSTTGGGTGSNIVEAFSFSTNGTHTICLSILTPTTGPSCTSTQCYTVAISNAPTSTCNLVAGGSNYLTPGPGGMGFINNSTGTLASTSYTWDFGDGSSSNTTNAIHNYAANGVYTVTLTASNNVTPACISTYTIPVTINNYCGLNPSFSYTQGANGTVNLSSTSTGTVAGVFYQWYFYDGGAIPAGPTATRTYTSNGIKTVCLEAQNPPPGNCTVIYCGTIAVTSVTVPGTPCTPTVMYTLTKDTTTALTWNAFPAYPPNITGATWSWGDGSTTTGLYPTHTYSAAGTYSTCVTVSVSCSTLTATYCYVANIFRSSENNEMVTINVQQPLVTGIKNQAKAGKTLNVYPNPSNGEFTLELMAEGNYSTENIVSIYTIAGEKVAEQTILTNRKQTIDVSNLTNGTYLLKINSEGRSIHKTITIQK